MKFLSKEESQPPFNLDEVVAGGYRRRWWDRGRGRERSIDYVISLTTVILIVWFVCSKTVRSRVTIHKHSASYYCHVTQSLVALYVRVHLVFIVYPTIRQTHCPSLRWDHRKKQPQYVPVKWQYERESNSSTSHHSSIQQRHITAAKPSSGTTLPRNHRHTRQET